MSLAVLMSRPVVTVEVDNSIQMIRDIFSHTHFHHLPVVENQKLVGIISDRDLLKVVTPKLGTEEQQLSDIEILQKRARDIMTPNPFTLTADKELIDVLDIIEQKKVSAIPVIDTHKKPIGIISWKDVLHLLYGIVKKG